MANSPGGEKRERERPQQHRQRRQPGVRDLSKRQPRTPVRRSPAAARCGSVENDTGTQPNVAATVCCNTTPRATPSTIPQTGAPITGTSRPEIVATVAIPAHTNKPGMTAMPDLQYRDSGGGEVSGVSGLTNRGHGTTRVCSPRRLDRRRPAVSPTARRSDVPQPESSFQALSILDVRVRSARRRAQDGGMVCRHVEAGDARSASGLDACSMGSFDFRPDGLLRRPHGLAESKEASMARCEMLAGCIFFNDKMQSYPFAADQMEQTYCVEGELPTAHGSSFERRSARKACRAISFPTTLRAPIALSPVPTRARPLTESRSVAARPTATRFARNAVEVSPSVYKSSRHGPPGKVRGGLLRASSVLSWRYGRDPRSSEHPGLG